MDKKKTKKKTITNSKEKSKSNSKEKSKGKTKEKSKEKSKEKTTTKNNIKKPKIKKIINTKDKKSSGDKKSDKSKSKNKSKSKVKKGKKSKSTKKDKKGKILKENESETIMITQKLDGNMFVKQKKEEKKKKTFTEIKIGTPHYDIIPYLKQVITEKGNSIKELYNEKQNMMEKIKNIYNKLDGMELLLEETPEQKDRIAMLYLVLNLNKKNHINSTNIKNKFKNDYKELLRKNEYDPIEKLNEYGNKINISKNENYEITKKIRKIKNINISSKFKIKNMSREDKKSYEINYLINELNSLNNEKHEALIKLKNSKRIIKSTVVRFENLLKIYDENKIINKDMNQTYIKLEKDINLLKKNLLAKNEDEIYEKVYNNQSLLSKNNIHIFKLKISRNNINSSEKFFITKRTNNIKKNKSIASIKINSYFFNESKENNSSNNNNLIKKKICKKNILPLIKGNNETINKSEILEQNESIQLNKSINYDELTESKINEINVHELNFKKEYYKIIHKKLENSIKDTENMYKRKIKRIEEVLKFNKNKYLDIKKSNDMLKIEIDNLYKIVRMQVKQFIELTEKKNVSYDFAVSNITNIDSN